MVIDFSVFMCFGVFCCWKVLQSASNLGYIIPLSLSCWHIYLACKWGNDLMIEYNETVEVLNEMEGDDVEKLKQELQKCPPQVSAFGGFKVNYSMLTAVLAFILSCIGIPGEMWPEDNQNCYEYHSGVGNFAKKNILCLGQKLFFNDSETLNLVFKNPV
ncbi:unnamed protein product, partial [Meganyctiphanes norvegica]